MCTTIWKKNGSCQNFEEYCLEHTGKTLKELSDTENISYQCPGIDQAGEILKEAVRTGRFICVITDYDADGLNSAAEIFMILRKLNVKNEGMRIIIPRRKKDGYGLNTGMLEGIPDGSLVITIDNGITAVEPIAIAKGRDMKVLVLDHHMQNGKIPNADLIIDPEAFPYGWTFHGYCGAGLTYKLAEYLFPEDTDLLDYMSCFAAIATIGDSVDVTGDNRNILRRGLKNLNAMKCTEGLSAIIRLLQEKDKLEHIDTYELAYKIAPMMNAPGRLDDAGGMKILQALFSRGERAKALAEELYSINDERKALVKNALENLSPVGEKIAFLYDEDLPEGLCGIVAGHLAQDLGRYAFVATKAENGEVKGSARCLSDQDVFALMQTAQDLFTRFGGHQCAAGFSLKEEDMDALIKKLEENAEEPSDEDIVLYDFEADQKDLFNIYIAMNRIGIFGEGLERPVLKVKTSADEVRLIGAEKTHLSFNACGIKAIGFSMAEKYVKLGEPKEVVMYGTFHSNWYRGRSSVQTQLEDVEDTSREITFRIFGKSKDGEAVDLTYVLYSKGTITLDELPEGTYSLQVIIDNEKYRFMICGRAVKVIEADTEETGEGFLTAGEYHISADKAGEITLPAVKNQI